MLVLARKYAIYAVIVRTRRTEIERAAAEIEDKFKLFVVFYRFIHLALFFISRAVFNPCTFPAYS